MKVLFVNPILYTSETKTVAKRKSIKDTMSYGLCKAFSEQGHDITLYACSSYQPKEKEDYPFHVVFEKATWTKLCPENSLPRLPKLKSFLKKNSFDLIICSEAFSLTTYTCVRLCPEKTIVWQELAAYQHALHQIPAKLWYNWIVKRKYKKTLVVARSPRAKKFISQFSDNVSDVIIDHGTDLSQFKASIEKRKQFIIVSQLIPRKRIDKSIIAFNDFCKLGYSDYQLIIIGDGESRGELEKLASHLEFSSHIVFKGFQTHDALIDDFSHSIALIISTEKDNNLITIDEAFGCDCPVVTNSVPFHSDLIKEKKLGYVKDDWNGTDLAKVVTEYPQYVENINMIRDEMDYSYKVKQFVSVQDGRKVR